MKKLSVLVSCFAVTLLLSTAGFAQEAAEPAAPCTCGCCTAIAPSVAPWMTLPVNYPGLSVNPREVRRLVRLDARSNLKQARLDARYSVPELQPYPVTVAPIDGVEGIDGNGLKVFAPGPLAQTGRWNNSVQRSSTSAPVINFLSIVGRGAPRFFDAPYGAQPIH